MEGHGHAHPCGGQDLGCFPTVTLQLYRCPFQAANMLSQAGAWAPFPSALETSCAIASHTRPFICPSASSQERRRPCHPRGRQWTRFPRKDLTPVQTAPISTSAASGKGSLQQLRPPHEDQTGRRTSGERRHRRTERAGRGPQAEPPPLTHGAAGGTMLKHGRNGTKRQSGWGGTHQHAELRLHQWPVLWQLLVRVLTGNRVARTALWALGLGSTECPSPGRKPAPYPSHPGSTEWHWDLVLCPRWGLSAA